MKSERDLKDEQIQALKDAKYRPPFRRLLNLSRPTWIVFPIAFGGALVAGFCMPIQAYLLGDALRAFYLTCDGLPPALSQPIHECPDAMLERINEICLFFCAVALAQFVGE